MRLHMALVVPNIMSEILFWNRRRSLSHLSSCVMYNLLLGLWLWFAMINTRSITIGKKYFFRTKKRAQPGLENRMTWIRKGCNQEKTGSHEKEKDETCGDKREKGSGDNNHRENYFQIKKPLKAAAKLFHPLNLRHLFHPLQVQSFRLGQLL